MSRLVDNYASALLHLSQHDDSAYLAISDLRSFVGHTSALQNKATPAKYRSLIVDALIAKKKLSVEVRKFIDILVKNNRLYMIDEILKRYDTKVLILNKKRTLEIDTAHTLSREQVNSVKQALSDKFGYQFIETLNVRPEILGGLVLKFGTLVIDASTKGMISSIATTTKKLAQNLNK